MKIIRHAEIVWDDRGMPRSAVFDDKYFDQNDGYAESIYTFCSGNHLVERFQSLKAQTFVIGETGFGTGLNFLSAWQMFERCAPAEAKLHFISLEKFPLINEDLGRSLSVWTDLTEQADPLIRQYDQLRQSGHVQFADGRVALTVIFDDVLTALDEMKSKVPAVDAWFLDGFAPSKNPEMWSPDVYQRMAALSHPGTTLATFTCAGHVRRGLEAVGFQMSKAQGFGLKRHMLKGIKV